MTETSPGALDRDAAARAASDSDEPEERRRNVLRYGAMLVVVVLIVGGTIYVFIGHDELPPPRQVRELTIVNIVPPPPPPPPQPQPVPEQKMIEQPKMVEPAIKEEERPPLERPKDEPAKEAKNSEPPGPLSLDAKPAGPGDLFNLGGKPGGDPFGGGGGGGSRWGWYASIVQSQIEAALRAHPKTRNAVMQVQLRLWADTTGRVSRIQLLSSTGDAELDSAIRDNVFTGVTLREPPPKDMPMPIVVRVTERRPS